MEKSNQIRDLSNKHLEQIISYYWDQYPSIKENNLDVDNFKFHRDFGLCLTVPSDWNIIETIYSFFCSKKLGKEELVVIFPSTQVYAKVFEIFGTGPCYYIWHEIYTASNFVNSDIRAWQQIKNKLSEAKLVIFLGYLFAPSTVLDQTRFSVNGCLISFGNV